MCQLFFTLEFQNFLTFVPLSIVNKIPLSKRSQGHYGETVSSITWKILELRYEISLRKHPKYVTFT